MSKIPQIHCCVACGAAGATKCLYCGSPIKWLEVAPRGYRCCTCNPEIVGYHK